MRLLPTENEEAFLLTPPISFFSRREKDCRWGDASVGGEMWWCEHVFSADMRLTVWVVACADGCQSDLSRPDATCISPSNCDNILKNENEMKNKSKARNARYLVLAAFAFDATYHEWNNRLNRHLIYLSAVGVFGFKLFILYTQVILDSHWYTVFSSRCCRLIVNSCKLFTVFMLIFCFYVFFLSSITETLTLIESNSVHVQ